MQAYGCLIGIRHAMAVTKSRLPADDRAVEILTSPHAGSLTRARNGDLLFAPGEDFADLVFGETRRVNFEYLREGKAGSSVGTGTVAVRAEQHGLTVKRFEFSDTQTVSHRILLEPGLSPPRPGRLFRIRRHPDKGSASISQSGELTFRPLSDFDNLMNGEARRVSLQCELIDTGCTRVYDVELTVKAGFHGVFVQRSVLKEQPVACES
jgi:hypothetical protein